jgi:hypothetical protein
MVIADPDDTCPGVWVELDTETGYCDLGDECRNPTRAAHASRIEEWVAGEDDE